MIELLQTGWDVEPLQQQLAAHPDVWNRHTMRTASEGTPHREVDDIWVRYNAWENFSGDAEAFNSEHESEWYPVVAQLPAAWSLARRVARLAGMRKLGGVLITRVPPGGEVKPHVDHGWHAHAHDKIAVQIQGNRGQSFCFDMVSLRTVPGDVYQFDNSFKHWVLNPTDQERITMIVCVRK
jgi:hypothetical protein